MREPKLCRVFRGVDAAELIATVARLIRDARWGNEYRAGILNPADMACVGSRDFEAAAVVAEHFAELVDARLRVLFDQRQADIRRAEREAEERWRQRNRIASMRLGLLSKLLMDSGRRKTLPSDAVRAVLNASEDELVDMFDDVAATYEPRYSPLPRPNFFG